MKHQPTSEPVAMFDASSGPPPPPPPVLMCGVFMEGWPMGWGPKRHPRCNRPKGHDGEHREIRRRDFKTMAAWPSQQRKGQS